MPTNSAPLKLMAMDPEDLQILSAHVQDATVRAEDMAYLAKQKRLVLFCNRFDWETALDGHSGGRRRYERRRAALRIERVLKARVQNIRLGAKDDVLVLLAVQFDPGEAPAGVVTLTFSGGAAIRLDVECVEAELSDQGAAWATRSLPTHPGRDTGPQPPTQEPGGEGGKS